MAAAATAAKLQMRVTRLQEAAAVLQERAWMQEAAGDLAKRGRFLLDAISSKSFNQHAPSARAAILGSSGLLVPSRPTRSADIIPDDPVESLVYNLAGRRDHGRSRGKSLQLVHAQTDGQGVSYSATKVGAAKVEWIPSKLTQSTEEEYGWETDPNGGWLSSFP